MTHDKNDDRGHEDNKNDCHETTTRVARLELSRQGVYRWLPSVLVDDERDGLS